MLREAAQMGKKSISKSIFFPQKRRKLLDCFDFEEKWPLDTLSHLPNKQACPSIYFTKKFQPCLHLLGTACSLIFQKNGNLPVY